jgi:hypothetical protein
MDALFAAAALLPKDTRIAVIGAEEKDIPELHRLYPDSMFIPFRPYKEVADNQAAADVLLLPNTGQNAMSARYTSPLKLFTYMASGIPIVASDIPSVREIVDDASALLVAPDDAEALAEGIIYTLQHAEQACVQSTHARLLNGIPGTRGRGLFLLPYTHSTYVSFSCTPLASTYSRACSWHVHRGTSAYCFVSHRRRLPRGSSARHR